MDQNGLENGVDQRGKTTDLFMTSSAGQFHLQIGCSFVFVYLVNN